MGRHAEPQGSRVGAPAPVPPLPPLTGLRVVADHPAPTTTGAHRAAEPRAADSRAEQARVAEQDTGSPFPAFGQLAAPGTTGTQRAVQAPRR
ncbi:hypothetical protein, partial [Klenkia sp. PcliD-1-E]|uniref:hypothetical protein n=1 Tax=Klenkia sp. PcliD-1-E TaxID=2954492 RepID=UPI002097982B